MMKNRDFSEKIPVSHPPRIARMRNSGGALRCRSSRMVPACPGGLFSVSRKLRRLLRFRQTYNFWYAKNFPVCAIFRYHPFLHLKILHENQKVCGKKKCRKTKNPVCGVIIFILANGNCGFSFAVLRRDAIFR